MKVARLGVPVERCVETATMTMSGERVFSGGTPEAIGDHPPPGKGGNVEMG